MTYFCETTNCFKPATVHYKKAEYDVYDGLDIYSFDACDDHLDNDPTYEATPIPAPIAGVDFGDPVGQMNNIFMEALRPFAPALFEKPTTREIAAADGITEQDLINDRNWELNHDMEAN